MRFGLALLLLLVANLVAATEVFSLSPQGDVAHWLASRRQMFPVEPTVGRDPRTLLAIAPPAGLLEAMGAPVVGTLPQGTPPRILFLGDVACAADYGFYRERVRVESVLAVDLLVPGSGPRDFLLWLDRGAVEVFIDGRSVLQAANRSTAVESRRFSVEVAAGSHRILMRRTCTGERNTPLQTGLRCLGAVEGVQVRLPVAPDLLASSMTIHRWLAGLRSAADGSLIAERAPDFPVTITHARAIMPWRPAEERRTAPWPAGALIVTRKELDPEALAMRVVAGDPDLGLERFFDWPYLAPLTPGPGGDLVQHRQGLLRGLDRADWVLFAGLDALRRLDAGMAATDPALEALVERMVKTIANKDGTSDFQMTAAIRLLFASKGRLTPDQEARLLRVLREVPYASDEGDTGTLSFSSENHQVMFQSCARLAAVLMPEAVFQASGRSAAEHGRLARERLQAWFAVRERAGFHEFLAPAYTNETFLALLNLVDYDPDPAVRLRAQGLLDTMVSLAALHGFRGLPLGPNGRCYRHELLGSHHEGRTAILSWFSSEAVVATHSITAALAHSTYPGPTTPLDLHGPVVRRDAMGGTTVSLRRTADYLLGACTIPSLLVQEPCNPFPFKAPGSSLYQHHLWEIALGGHARIFTQSPATVDECLDARPGYWVGEQSAPTLAEVDGMVMAIYRLAPDAMVPFTHAWWPAPAFDAEVVDGSWAFARKGDGYAALWCSQPLQRRERVAQHAELRAYGPSHAWIAWASSRSEAGTFERFQQQCRDRRPAYDPASGRLSLDGRLRLTYGEVLPATAPIRPSGP